MFDLKITGGTVVDGTGADRFDADIAVKDGKIVEIRRRGAAVRRWKAMPPRPSTQPERSSRPALSTFTLTTTAR